MCRVLCGTRQCASSGRFTHQPCLLRRLLLLKVRWEGYHPSWEVFRQEGEGKRGDPVLTWEPEAEMLHTDAYKEWLERSAASRA